MSGKTLAWEAAVLKLLLNGAALANVMSNASTSPITTIWLSLHTSDPGKTGTQTTNEASYAGYARLATARSTLGWAVDETTGVATPLSDLLFPAPTSPSAQVITHVGFGSSGSGDGFLFYSGAISPAIYLVVGTQPKLLSSSTVSET